jgi:hypothetical protein
VVAPLLHLRPSQYQLAQVSLGYLVILVKRSFMDSKGSLAVVATMLCVLRNIDKAMFPSLLTVYMPAVLSMLLLLLPENNKAS